MRPDFYMKDKKDFRAGLIVTPFRRETLVLILACHHDQKKNNLVKIPCGNSVPIPGYVYCKKTDSVLIRCYESLDLGTIPVSYRASIHGSSDWDVAIPMPGSVIKRYLNFSQRKKLKEFRDKFKDSPNDIMFNFMQFQAI